MDFLENKRKDAEAGRPTDPIWITHRTIGKMTNLRYGDLWMSAAIHRMPGQDIPEESQAPIAALLKDSEDARAAGFSNVKAYQTAQREKRRQEGALRASPTIGGVRSSGIDVTRDPPTGKFGRQDRLAWLAATNRSPGNNAWHNANPDERFRVLKSDEERDLASELAPRGEMNYTDFKRFLERKGLKAYIEWKILANSGRAIMSRPGVVPPEERYQV